jgi:glutamate dehydrogenase
MALAAERNHATQLQRVSDIINKSGRAEKPLTEFIDIFLSDIDETELDGLTPEGLAELAVSGWDFVAQRPAGRPKVRVFTADQKVTGEAKLIVIQILCDDMPFLVDSVMGEILERKLGIQMVIHPVLLVERDGRRKLNDIKRSNAEVNGGVYQRECFIQVHIDHLDPGFDISGLGKTLESIIAEVQTVVDDWRPMLKRLERAIGAYTTYPPPVPVSDLAEGIQFLRWLIDKNFTFLGMVALAFVGGSQRGRLEPVAESGLGILRDEDVRVLRRGHDMVRMTPEIRKFILSPSPLIIAKANVRSRVHRRAHMDYIGVKIYGEKGDFSGELRIVGLFTSSAYTKSVTTIPAIRHKVDTVMRQSGFSPDGQGSKALFNVLETYPRDELFQIETAQLFEFALTIQQLDLRPRVRALPRLDEFDRFVSIIVYLPRNGFSTDGQHRIGNFLADTYRGRVSAVYPFFPEGPLVRVHYIIGRYEGSTPVREQAFLEDEITKIIRTWPDQLERRLVRELDGGTAARRWEAFASAFPAAYQESVAVDRALADIEHIEQLSTAKPVAIDFYRRRVQSPKTVRVTLYSLSGPIPLSRRVPIFENLGFSVIDESSYTITPTFDEAERTVSLHDMVLMVQDGEALRLGEHKERLEETFLAVWADEAADDHYNRLVLKAGMAWREAAVMRAYGSYLRQIRSPFGQSYLSDTLIRHVGITRNLIALFRQLFDPERAASVNTKNSKERGLIRDIEQALEAIPSLDEDRIVRQFLNLVCHTLRTNFYARDAQGEAPETISFKFDSQNIDGAPEPRPFAEIFVSSPRVEGIHLRGGRIARGGLRWSDRHQDFRTEVLGLAKAQQVKNTVIVPTGSKGGFVPKWLPEGGDRDAVMSEGVAAYKIFINALLSLTDNLVGGKVVPPKNMIRHDGDDPYLVVAADKGTATLSDTANEISTERGFWLGDAFASGGSAGYDHKKMAITARGGWEAVKRHFREMDIDIQTTPFSVVGVGDMSGDVFGNGMLLSKQIKLLAAFDHRDIFIDPDPDPAKSWTERRRLFMLTRSSWQDYSKKLISKGGGVYSRAAKSIALSDEVKALTGLEKSAATPNELVRALLKSQADLMWFGGIGTYVRGHGETDEQAGDRANDALRIEADELAVKVVGEGANLGLTQNARIAFARAGGCVNTDAIDNSAGVNSSDLEVNIKIALGQAIENGKLDLAARNKLLVEMTDEVANACLRNNYLQTLTISLARRRGLADLGFQIRMMRELESTGLLNREVEFLPDDGALAERQAQGEALSRPELAVLLAYAKIDLYDELIASKVPDDPYFERELMGYFPPMLQKRYGEEVEQHRLRRDIITTRLVNNLVNRAGASAVTRLKDETGHAADAIMLAYTAARGVFDTESLCGEIDQLDNKVGGEFQLNLYMRVQDVLRQQTGWFLRHADLARGLSDVIERYSGEIAAIGKSLTKILTPHQKTRLEAVRGQFAEHGVPPALCERLCVLPFLATGSDIVLVADALKKPVMEVAPLFAEVAAFFRIDELRHASDHLAVDDYFDRLAINNTVSAFADIHRALVYAVAAGAKRGPADFKAWCKASGPDTERARRRVQEILEGGEITLSRLTVAAAYLRELVSK